LKTRREKTEWKNRLSTAATMANLYFDQLVTSSDKENTQLIPYKNHIPQDHYFNSGKKKIRFNHHQSQSS
jgi:hypothetical protein